MNKMMYASAGAMVILSVAVFAATPGCSVDKNAPATDTSDAALHDPMNYKESVPTPDSISGGDTGNLDSKGLKKDLDSVFNP